MLDSVPLDHTSASRRASTDTQNLTPRSTPPPLVAAATQQQLSHTTAIADNATATAAAATATATVSAAAPTGSAVYLPTRRLPHSCPPSSTTSPLPLGSVRTHGFEKGTAQLSKKVCVGRDTLRDVALGTPRMTYRATLNLPAGRTTAALDAIWNHAPG